MTTLESLELNSYGLRVVAPAFLPRTVTRLVLCGKAREPQADELEGMVEEEVLWGPQGVEVPNLPQQVRRLLLAAAGPQGGSKSCSARRCPVRCAAGHVRHSAS